MDLYECGEECDEIIHPQFGSATSGISANTDDTLNFNRVLPQEGDSLAPTRRDAQGVLRGGGSSIFGFPLVAGTRYLLVLATQEIDLFDFRCSVSAGDWNSAPTKTGGSAAPGAAP